MIRYEQYILKQKDGTSNDDTLVVCGHLPSSMTASFEWFNQLDCVITNYIIKTITQKR